MPDVIRFVLTWLVAIPLVLSLHACRPVSAGSDDVRRSLAGSRWLQPRLSGLADFEPCSSSRDLIPVARCGERPSHERLAHLRELQHRLGARSASRADSDQLHGAALVRLVLDAGRPTQIETAITYLREALALEASPHARAELLTDLSGAHLLLAEQLQTPLEVAVGLEAALAALELEGANEEARFNRELALLLLGIAEPETRTGDDPWLEEVRQRFSSPPPEPATMGGCPSAATFRPLLDTWAAAPSIASWAPLAQARLCWEQTEDRFFAAVLDQADVASQATAQTWNAYNQAEAALFRGEVDRVEARLRALEALRPALPVVLAARRLEGIVAYQREDYPRALAVFEPLAGAAEAAGFFRLAGETHRLMALIAHVRGEIAEVFRQLELARAAARMARYPTLDAAIASLRIEVLQKVGREEEAWRGVVETLRAPVPERREMLELFALQTAAQLAKDRGLDRVAQALHDRRVGLAERLGPSARISSLRLRGELLVELGRSELARADLALARELLATGGLEPAVATTLGNDLLLLEGLAASEPAQKRAALETLVSAYRAGDYNLRILEARLALARSQREDEDAETALSTLEAALDELAAQVAGGAQWSDAPALVRAARPLAEELLALVLERRGASEVRATLARFFGLRSGVDELGEGGALPRGEQRLTTFALPHEVVLLLETGDRLVLERRAVERAHLAELRERWVLQLRNHVEPSRLRATAEPLSELVLAPVLAEIEREGVLTVVADDVLAALPFHLLPTGEGEELLLDRVAVRYGTDLRPIRESVPLTRSLVVGVSAAPPGLLPLRAATGEAQEVAGLLTGSTLLLEPDLEALRQALGDAEAVHLSGHFLANTRAPLESFLFLGGEGAQAERLTLRELLAAGARPPRLLYLSACDTGRGLPVSAHGLSSLAQAFASAGVERTVLTLWPLDDRMGGALAASFYRRLLAGEPAATALRGAQLEHRGEHPSKWGSLAVVE